MTDSYPNQQHVHQHFVRGPSNGKGVAALVVGVIAVFFGVSVPIPVWGLIVSFLAFPLSVVAIILGHLGMSTARRVGMGRGNSLAGAILGYVTLGICVLTTGFWFSAIAGAASAATI
ncbi:MULTISPECIES: DUF4190 domain-containing protein [unclassified Microbacterium]|uniref:DUF4190 domain-containing protein n=1 Tax=unclassified Microbacterium TaxID=2609290 RepID=UPI00214BCA7E|nr:MULTISPECIES: DUF4190 domain-containing protein [unclassified Microbacterium]MCR2783750.1 DUF4190 domain-containing protein [Microbacterium sp. zg.B96]MDL5351451.1 DUF4190 domain-containing protein [Microbacterium sp. zg-YB36]WIM15397.1 DUF4190 domain-containing protein [Microbacterium sp. zg-B96]